MQPPVTQHPIQSGSAHVCLFMTDVLRAASGHAYSALRGFPGVAVVKNPPANAGDTRDAGSIPELGTSPGRGHGNPLQYSCLENPMDREAWRATIHRVTQNWTQLNMSMGSQRVGPSEQLHFTSLNTHISVSVLLNMISCYT